MSNSRAVQPKAHWTVWLMAIMPGVMAVSFIVQALQARLILGRNPRACLDAVSSPIFDLHRHAGELLLLATLFAVLPIFVVTAAVRCVKRKPTGFPALCFALGTALCGLLVVTNPWNYVDWWLD